MCVVPRWRCVAQGQNKERNETCFQMQHDTPKQSTSGRAPVQSLFSVDVCILFFITSLLCVRTN